MNKEHFWPEWLIAKTRTNETSVKWMQGKRINPRSATFPLCHQCNTDFGRELEQPVSRIFDQLEGGAGLSDWDAELLIRWLWKFEGLVWLACYPLGLYSPTHTLRDRVLNPLGDTRTSLSLAVSLIRQIDPMYGDAPLGIDSDNHTNAIFVSGVFSRVSLMVLLWDFKNLVPANFSIYRLAHAPDEFTKQARLFHPKVGFVDDTEAVGVTRMASIRLSVAHEQLAHELADNKDT